MREAGLDLHLDLISVVTDGAMGWEWTDHITDLFTGEFTDGTMLSWTVWLTLISRYCTCWIRSPEVMYCILFATRTPYADQIGLYYGCTKRTGRVCKYR